jgi:iron complex outermembrane recepter protein
VTDASTLTEEFEDTTVSFGVEDSYAFLEHYTLVAGLGYDIKSSDCISDPNVKDNGDETAWNPQAALIADLAPKQTLRISIAQKTYFPSMKERYSYKLGYGVPNADLKPEKTTSNELAYKGVINDAWVIDGALFYSVIEDYIQSVYYDNYNGQDRTQNQNVGTYYRSGAEVSVDYLAERFQAGANATFLNVESSSDNELIGVPTREYNFYVRAFATPQLNALFAIGGQSGAYGQMADGSYIKLGDVLTMDAKLAYSPTKALTAELGVKNLADALNYYDDGYPQPGREFYGKLSYNF